MLLKTIVTVFIATTLYVAGLSQKPARISLHGPAHSISRIEFRKAK